MKLHLNERVIAFHPIYAKILGGIEEAIFFQQICFWSDKGKRDDGAIYKTSKDIEEETTLSDRVQRRVKKKLRELGLLEIWLEKVGGGPVCHYRVHWDVLRKCLKDFYQLSESSIYSETTPRKKNAVSSKQETATTSSRGKFNATNVRMTRYKNPAVQEIVETFVRQCEKNMGIAPVIGADDFRMASYALNRGGLSKEMVFEMIDDWFAQPTKDGDILHLTRAISKSRINTYRGENVNRFKRS